MGNKFTHKITFGVSPKLKFSTQETYPFVLGKITPMFKGNELCGFEVYLSVDPNLTDQEVVDLARQFLEPLISRLSFETNMSMKSSIKSVRNLIKNSEIKFNGLDIEISLGKMNIPMPKPEPSTLDPMSDTVSQLSWFKLGISSKSVIEKIASFYKILEIEENTTSYKIKDEFKYVRHAVSHSSISKNKKAQKYLTKNIGQNFIDPHNPKHIRFLKGKEELIENEARRVIKNKFPRL